MSTLVLAICIGGIILVIVWGLVNAQLKHEERQAAEARKHLLLRRELDRQPGPTGPNEYYVGTLRPGESIEIPLPPYQEDEES